jgi:hypothetical protein
MCFGSVFVFYNEFTDHGDHRGNTVQALARWRHPVALSEARDVLHRAMRPALYLHITMVIETATDFPVFFVIIDSVVAHNRS